MLLLNPEQCPSQLNLQQYTILDCEPLHDIKGHFLNLFSELTYLFKGEDRTTCKQVISANKGSTMTGAKCHVCMIELFVHLLHRPVSSEILLLVETAVRISELLYMHDADRNTRNILQLYNCVWLHHELCSKLITTFHSGMSYNKLFGAYLHALVAHAPQQLEIVSLRSVNTENQERIFEQAQRSATAASNRHPSNVLSTTVLRLQAKAAFIDIADATQNANRIVARSARELPMYKGTTITKEFISSRSKSWQCHLQRIAHYLVHGKGVWWEDTHNGYRFFDGSNDPTSHPEGPVLRHFRSTKLQDVFESARAIWKQILEKKLDLPTPLLQLYDNNGLPVPQSPQDENTGESNETGAKPLQRKWKQVMEQEAVVTVWS